MEDQQAPLLAGCVAQGDVGHLAQAQQRPALGPKFNKPLGVNKKLKLKRTECIHDLQQRVSVTQTQLNSLLTELQLLRSKREELHVQHQQLAARYEEVSGQPYLQPSGVCMGKDSRCQQKHSAQSLGTSRNPDSQDGSPVTSGELNRRFTTMALEPPLPLSSGCPSPSTSPNTLDQAHPNQAHTSNGTHPEPHAPHSASQKPALPLGNCVSAAVEMLQASSPEGAALTSAQRAPSPSKGTHSPGIASPQAIAASACMNDQAQVLPEPTGAALPACTGCPTQEQASFDLAAAPPPSSMALDAQARMHDHGPGKGSRGVPRLLQHFGSDMAMPSYSSQQLVSHSTHTASTVKAPRSRQLSRCNSEPNPRPSFDTQLSHGQLLHAAAQPAAHMHADLLGPQLPRDPRVQSHRHFTQASTPAVGGPQTAAAVQEGGFNAQPASAAGTLQTCPSIQHSDGVHAWSTKPVAQISRARPALKGAAEFSVPYPSSTINLPDYPAVHKAAALKRPFSTANLGLHEDKQDSTNLASVAARPWKNRQMPPAEPILLPIDAAKRTHRPSLPRLLSDPTSFHPSAAIHSPSIAPQFYRSLSASSGMCAREPYDLPRLPDLQSFQSCTQLVPQFEDPLPKHRSHSIDLARQASLQRSHSDRMFWIEPQVPDVEGFWEQMPAGRSGLNHNTQVAAPVAAPQVAAIINSLGAQQGAPTGMPQQFCSQTPYSHLHPGACDARQVQYAQRQTAFSAPTASDAAGLIAPQPIHMHSLVTSGARFSDPPCMQGGAFSDAANAAGTACSPQLLRADSVGYSDDQNTTGLQYTQQPSLTDSRHPSLRVADNLQFPMHQPVVSAPSISPMTSESLPYDLPGGILPAAKSRGIEKWQVITSGANRHQREPQQQQLNRLPVASSVESQATHVTCSDRQLSASGELHWQRDAWPPVHRHEQLQYQGLQHQHRQYQDVQHQHTQYHGAHYQDAQYPHGQNQLAQHQSGQYQHPQYQDAQCQQLQYQSGQYHATQQQGTQYQYATGLQSHRAHPELPWNSAAAFHSDL